MDDRLKPLHWIGSSLADLGDLPEPVRNTFGYALYIAQRGMRHDRAKPLKGFGGAGVLEIVESHDGNAYRAVYTVKFAQAAYVLHVFQKKSKKGVATPTSDIDLIRKRLKAAEDDYVERYGERK